MAVGTSVVWDEVFTAYDFGPTHPMAPVRLDLTTRLARSLGVLDHVTSAGRRASPTTTCSPRCTTATTSPPCAAASADPGAGRPAPRAGHRRRPGLRRDARGVGPHRPGHPSSSAAACGRATLEHGGQLLRRAAPRDARLAASGFCVYNDVARRHPAAARPRRERVAYVDVDVHHGDGVERMFWDDPRVLTVSVHESGRHALPRHRLAGRDRRPVGARARSVNVALPPGTGDSGWLRAIDSVVPPLVRAFAPEVLVTQHGCDTHLHDPLAHLAISRRRPARWPTSRCTSWRTRWPPGAGSPSAAAATRSSTSCRGRGPTWPAIAAHRAGRRRHGGAAGVARPRAASPRPGRPRRRMGDLGHRAADLVRPWSMRPQPRRRRRPRGPRDPPGDLPAPRPGPLVRLTDAVGSRSGARLPGSLPACRLDRVEQCHPFASTVVTSAPMVAACESAGDIAGVFRLCGTRRSTRSRWPRSDRSGRCGSSPSPRSPRSCGSRR